MTNKQFITIAIPAYNEANNIGRLLHLLLQQTNSDYISEILIVSDASTDNTVAEIKKIKDKRITLIRQPKRLGKNATLNNLFQRAKKSTIFVQLDADVIPIKKNFLEKLVKPIVNADADLVAADILAIKPTTFIEHFTTWGHDFRTTIYQHLHATDNVYLCYGRARAFSQKLYTHLRFPNECPEDSYSYLFLKKIGGKFVYQKNAQVYFRSPASFSDYIHQSSSFVAGKQALKQFFSPNIVTKAFNIPFALYIQAFWNCLVKDPIHCLLGGLGYVGLTIFRKLFIHIPKRYTSKYTYLSTTKITSGNNGKIP